MRFGDRSWGLGAPLLAGVLALGSTSRAEAGPGARLGHAQGSHLDGHYLSIGPVVGAAALDDSWNSYVGAELSWVRVREGRWPAALGIALGGASWGGEPGGKAWAEFEAGIDRPSPLKLGLGIGPVITWDGVEPPRWGAQGTLFVFAGLIPYVRAGVMAGQGPGTGPFFEVGLMIKIPAKILY